MGSLALLSNSSATLTHIIDILITFNRSFVFIYQQLHMNQLHPLQTEIKLLINEPQSIKGTYICENVSIPSDTNGMVCTQ